MWRVVRCGQRLVLVVYAADHGRLAVHHLLFAVRFVVVIVIALVVGGTTRHFAVD